MDIAAVHHFVGAVCTFLKRVSVDVDVQEVGEKTTLLFRQDYEASMALLQRFLVTVQDVMSCLRENNSNLKMELEDSECAKDTQPLPETGAKVIKESSRKTLEHKLVQIKADKTEMDRRISAFIERKQKEVDDTNVREFCGLLRPNSEGHSCARTDAVFIPRSDSKSHVKVTKVENLYGPQTRLLNTSNQMDMKVPGVKEEVVGGASERLTGVEERLKNMEEHVQTESGFHDVFKRVKALEERILYLEGISPEYFSVSSSKRGTTRNDRVHSKRQAVHQSQAIETSSIDAKMQQLKAKILAKKVKQDPG